MKKKAWGKGSLFLQLIIIMFILTSVPTVLAITMNINSMRKLSEKAITSSAITRLQANQKLCDSMLSEYIYEALDFILGKEYGALRKVPTYQELNSEYSNVRLVMKMNENMENFVERNTPVQSVFFYADGADYVVSTMDGLVRLEEFNDRAWLEEIMKKKRRVSGEWYTRKMLSKNSEMPTEILSYVYSSNILYTTSKITIVINVYEEEILKLLYSEESGMTGEGCLVDGEGNVLVHSDTTLLHRNIADSMNTILTSREDSGVIQDGTEFVVYQKSNLYDWVYVNAWSNDQIFKETEYIYRTGIVMALLFILIGNSFAVVISYWISKPIRKLVNQMKELNPEQAETDKNEMRFLSDALEQIKEREQRMENSLEEMKEAAQVRAFYNLVHGDALQEEQRKSLEECFPYHHFILCMLVQDDAVRYQTETTHEERRIYRNMLYEYIKQIMPQEYYYMCIRYDVTKISLVVNFKEYDSGIIEEVFRKMMEQIKSFCNTNIGWTITCGVSTVHNSLDGIRLCLEETMLAVEQRLIMGKDKIIFAQDYLNKKTQLFDFTQSEKKIVNYMELGQTEKLRKELDIMVADIKAAANVSTDNVMLIFHQLVGTILMWLNKNNYSPIVVLGEQSGKLYKELVDYETIDEKKEYIIRILEKIIIYRENERKEQEKEQDDDNYVHQIIRYIRKNYRQDIEFDKIAGEIGISYSYARRIFKNNTGVSMIEYLNHVRLEEAKLLIETQNITMRQAAEAVGFHNVQSLQRAFKKYEGIAPNTYRAISNSRQNDE